MQAALAILAAIPPESWGMIVAAVLGLFGVRAAQQRRAARIAADIAADLHPHDAHEQQRHVEDALIGRQRRAVAKRAARAIRARLEREERRSIADSEKPTRPGKPGEDIVIPGPHKPPSVHPRGRRL